MEEKQPTKDKTTKPVARCSSSCFPKRYVIVTLTAIAFCIVHAMRVNIAVTVVTILDAAAPAKVGTVEAIVHLPRVQWDARQIGFLHSVFYIGYLITLIPGGFFATVLPATRLFGGSILVTCSLNLLLPLSISSFGYVPTCIIRIFQGLSEGLYYPAGYAILRHWATPAEKSRMGSLVLTGVYLGPVIGLPVSGYITHFIQWHYVYYVFGGLGIFWFLFWLFLAYETPAQHPSITAEELNFITEAQGDTAVVYENEKIPWMSILTSMPVHALNVCNFARSWVFFLLLTNEPTYLNTFGFTIAENGIFSSLPHIMMTLMSACSGPIADALMTNPMLTSTDVRKMFTCIGFGCEAVFLFCLYFINSGIVALIYLVIGIGFSGFTISGWQINHLDLAPRYASVLVGLSTAVGTVAGITIPLVVGHMTVHQKTAEWQNVFLLTSWVLVFAVIFYLFFGSGERQPWADPKPTEVRLIPENQPRSKPYTLEAHKPQLQNSIDSEKSQNVPPSQDSQIEQPSENQN